MTEIIINLGERSYPVYIERGSANNAIARAEQIVTDKNVFAAYRNLLRNKEKVLIIPPGETSKSPEEYIDLARKLKDAEELTALGGGVIGDLTGLIASTLRRGIPLMQIPTTLVAMVDASIGGKNGINLGGRKNYLGTIYQPAFVQVDPEFLKTLPEREFANGKAEIVKYAAIGDDLLLERLQEKLSVDNEDLENIIARCINIKKQFVESDEYDKGSRHALNFGHTLGHALELLYNLSHGEAIAIGMSYESEIVNIGDKKANLIRKALVANNLPITLPDNADTRKLIQLMKADKKGPLTFVISQHFYQIQKSEESIIETLESPINKPSEEPDPPF